MEKYIYNVVKTQFLQPLLDYLEKEKKIKISDDDLSKIYFQTEVKASVEDSPKTELKSPNTKNNTNETKTEVKPKAKNTMSDDGKKTQCIYIYQKKTKGQQCTKTAKYFGYCNTHKVTVKAKKDIENRKNNKRSEIPPLDETYKVEPKENKPTLVTVDKTPEVITSNLEDQDDDEIYELYKDDEMDLYVRPSLKHILSIKNGEDGYKLVWLYKYKDGKWEIPSQNEIKSMDTIDEKYVSFEDYFKLDPEKTREKIIDAKINLSHNPFYTAQVKKELGIVQSK